MSIFSKALEAVEASLDARIAKARTTDSPKSDEGAERKSIVDMSYPDEAQYGWKEKTGLVGAGVLKNMARKDSIIISIINTRLAQLEPFTKPQKDRYSAGWKVQSRKPVDLDPEEKLELDDPALDEDMRKQKSFELEKKRLKLKAKEAKEILEIEEFVMHSGMPDDETDTSHKRWDFDKFCKAITWDRLVYNYSAIELIPTKGTQNDKQKKLHHYYPVSAGTIKFVSERSQMEQMKNLTQFMDDESKVKKNFDASKPYKFVQVVRGRIIAAFTEDDLIFEPATPTIDPEDNGYAPGELELLIQTVTAHLYAEAHNRNFFTQGIGTKGILHIKGDNISRAQLEGFKRQWFSQVVNSKNAFRPPVIGMADDVKWVSLAQSNREMEFEQWMNYLIRIACAVYQIDPAEINFDISKSNSSSLQEANNEERLKNSRDKGLQPLLNYIENLVNRHILRYWNKDLADKYEFKFVGFNAESREQEMKRLETETKVWKTLNEARVEMGVAPIADGDIVLNATYTQYLAQKQMAEQGGEDGMPGDGEPGSEDGDPNAGEGEEIDSLTNDILDTVKNVEVPEPEEKTPEETKKSVAQVEYYLSDEE